MQQFAVIAALLVPGTFAVTSAPDVSSKVTQESRQNIQIHDGFMSQEEKDVEEEQKIRHDPDMSALQTSRSSHEGHLRGVVDPCAGIQCAASLTCPAGFSVTKSAGHCCPYCVNPDVKLEAAVTGASGKSGGKPSTTCKDVWCFPTMCTGTEVAPTTTNGKCCATCEA
eukprot:TRINITY_DN45697_c0_g1_i1.p1 TRINITY_DN45697_c0_g1~~TRINITY_DN45697_c0_g1_i1.p1  ORF type:complete len:190 (+),score=37.05 TRINITY_DN45697_c0_g1_i1:69-572(+)